MGHNLMTLDGEVAPFPGPITNFELVWAILLALERIAAAMEQSAKVHAQMLERMQEPESNTAHAAQAFV